MTESIEIGEYRIEWEADERPSPWGVELAIFDEQGDHWGAEFIIFDEQGDHWNHITEMTATLWQAIVKAVWERDRYKLALEEAECWNCGCLGGTIRAALEERAKE